MPENIPLTPIPSSGARHPADDSELALRWAYNLGSDELLATQEGLHTRNARLGEVAIALLDEAGPIAVEDIDLAYAAASAEEVLRESVRKQNERTKAQIEHIDTLSKAPKDEGHATNLATARKQKLTKMRERGTGVPEKLSESRVVVDALTEALDNRERTALGQAIESRIEADKLPWTLPGVDEARAAQLKQEFEMLFGDPQDTSGNRLYEPLPDDQYAIVPLKNQRGFSEEDTALMGPDLNKKHTNVFTRQQLQEAGVFFINSAGDGEQPLFGEPIPDATQPDGYFHPEKRVFLTRQEVEKVYTHQMQQLEQAGISVNEVNIPELQLKLMMLAETGKLPEGCDAQVIGLGGRERDPQGSVMRSPFVDSGYKALKSIGAMIRSGDGTRFSDYLRINTTSAALLDGHPDFPGLSEMRMTNDERPVYPGISYRDSASHDQRYANLAEILQSGWLPPLPTKSEALHAIQTGGQTQREAIWSAK